MPSTYAHFRFGNSVKQRLPKELRELIGRNYDCFALGLHGPDLLFYYKPLQTNDVNAQGYAMHEEKAADFFAKAKEIYAERGKKESDFAYLSGFLCHFSLDSESHGIVNAEMERCGFSHAGVESAFDKFLMKGEGKNPFKTDFTAHISNTPETRSAACAYFGISEKTAEKCIKSIKLYNRLLRTRGIARAMVNGLLKISGTYEVMHGMLVPVIDDPQHDYGNSLLAEAFENAADKATELILNYASFLEEKGNLSDKLNRNYE